MGAWDKPGVNIGPIVNAKQHRKVIAHLKDAELKGARFLLGHADYQPPFIQPTVVAEITADMLLEQEETFGPVVAISRFNDIAEAIARANNSPYGLSASVFGGGGAAEAADKIEAGMVGINQGGGGVGPWVGAKQSGFGFHGGAAGHRQFAQVRVLSN